MANRSRRKQAGKPLIVALIILALALWAMKKPKNDFSGLRNGDIIFQTSLSAQSKAIQKATNSPYSHCGIVFVEHGKLFVFEAVEPVKKTPLENWVKRGKEGKFVVKRLKGSERILKASVLAKMTAEAKAMNGKHYDFEFDWSDRKIYCSELIWKVYKRGAGIEVGKLQKLRDFDLSDPEVKKLLAKRYGKKIPLDETVISPVAIFNSGLLETVMER